MSDRRPAQTIDATGVALARRAPLAFALALPATGAAVIAAAAAGEPSSLVPGSGRAFPGWLAGPLAVLDAPRLDAAGVGIVLLLMFGAYVVVLARAGAVPRRAALTAIVAAHVAVLLAPPLLSADVFGYLGYTRLAALHGVSPYVHGACRWAPTRSTRSCAGTTRAARTGRSSRS